MIPTEITGLLGIRYPLFQGGMAWAADAGLAAAVSEGGGLGIIAAANMPPDLLEAQIALCRSLTGRPFGVNVMMLSPHVEEIARLCADLHVPVITTGAGNPAPYIARWKDAGCRVIPVIPTVALAKRMERAGADAVVAEGCEAGGHIGKQTTMCLVPQVADAVSIPVIAAGGIADGRGAAAALMLGAKGFQLGTVFLCAEECPAHPSYKQAVVDAKDTGTVVTGGVIGKPVRSLKTRFTKELEELERRGATMEEIEERALGSLRCAVQEGDSAKGSFMAGQIAGLVWNIRPAARIIEDIIQHTEEVLSMRRGPTIG